MYILKIMSLQQFYTLGDKMKQGLINKTEIRILKVGNK